MTVGDWLETWIALYVRPSGLAVSTKACYNRAVQSVPESLRSRDMQTITPLDLMPWLCEVARTHPRAAQLDRAMLSKSLRLAHKLGLCPGCIIDADTLPKPPHAPAKAAVLRLDEVRRYVAAAGSSPLFPLLMLCLCGLRRGEALGARWEDLDGNVLHVQRQRIRVERQYRVTALKSGHAMRELELPQLLEEDLRRRRRDIAGWICDTTPEKLHTEHRRAMQRAGLEGVTLHGLRHTFAAQAAAQGETMKHLQTALGHARMALTADLYADHSDPLSALPARVWRGL